MSVPLDRLYNFLRDLCDQDIIIYRWYPHGSRKSTDCGPLKKRAELSNLEKILVPHMICHDQEPLNFDWFLGNKKQLLYSLTNNVFHCYDKMLLCHSEKNSSELARFEDSDAIGVYWWCHALIAQDWFRFAQVDPTLQSKNIRTDFLIYNRAWTGTREYRLKFAEMIVDAELDPNCLMGFNPVDQDQHYYQYHCQNPSFAVNRSDLEHHFFINNTLPSASADYNSADYQCTGIEVVLETLFDDTRWHLTEKALRPIACGQPFILAATPGSLEYLRSYGFKTFGSVIDESYDCIVDPVDRLAAIVDLMRTIANHHNKTQLYADLQTIAQHNQQRFFSTEFYKTVVDEYRTNLAAGLSTLSQHTSGKHFRKLTKAYKSVDRITAHTGYTRSDLLAAWQWLRARDVNVLDATV